MVQRLLDKEGQRDGFSIAMDGTTAPQRRGMAQRLLGGEGRRKRGGRRRWTESTTAMGGDGWQDGDLSVMDGAARRRWTAQQQLDSKGRRDGDSTTKGEEEQCNRDGDVDTAGSGSDKGQHGIKI
jgi:hypothetical protein